MKVWSILGIASIILAATWFVMFPVVLALIFRNVESVLVTVPWIGGSVILITTAVHCFLKVEAKQKWKPREVKES